MYVNVFKLLLWKSLVLVCKVYKYSNEETLVSSEIFITVEFQVTFRENNFFPSVLSVRGVKALNVNYQESIQNERYTKDIKDMMIPNAW